MPAAPEALAAAHLTAQDRIADAAIQTIVGYWLLSQLATGEESPGGGIDLLGSANDWLDRSARVLATSRRQSAALSRVYYRQARAFEAPGAPPVRIPTVEPVAKQLRSSLWLAGPFDYLDGAEREEAHDWAPTDERRIKQIEGTVTRLTLDGGRGQIQAAIKADRVAVGFSREIRSSNPCWLCVMLASRGIVYSEDSFDASDARFVGTESDVKVHNGDRCGYVPHFTGKPGDHPGQTEEWEKVWLSRPGVDPNRPDDTEQLAFRRYWEARQREQAAGAA